MGGSKHPNRVKEKANQNDIHLFAALLTMTMLLAPACASAAAARLVEGAIVSYHNSITAAFDAISSNDGASVQAQAGNFREDLLLDVGVPVTLTGGLDSSYSQQVGSTLVEGALTIASGSLVTANIVLSTPHTVSTYPSQIDLAEVTQAGNVFYVDPATGDINNNGSSSEPWNTLQAVVENNKIESLQPASYPYTSGGTMQTMNSGAPVKAGDTIVLKAGYHGDILIRGYFNAAYINVIADSGAIVSGLHVQAGCKWRFKGLTVRPNAGNNTKYSMVHLESHNWYGPVSNITVDDFSIYTVADAAASWSTTEPTDWDSLSCHGIRAYGNNMTLRRNYLKNVDFGITVDGNYALVYGNTVENFAGDGMRGLGNDLFFEYNLIKNCYSVNANHDDGFQSWSINDDPPRERIVLRGNTFINYTDPNQPFRGTLQGIGCFDGWYIDWVIENNVIITDHWHGISLYGARNCRIVNNTVIDQNNTTPGPPWIGFFNHKDGTPSSNCLIRNNIAPAYQIRAGTTADHNYTIPSYASYSGLFIDHINFNLHLKGGVNQIDTGSTELAPTIDMEGRARPNGSGIDLGAYEYYSDFIAGGASGSGLKE